jgi:diguanylate cyclase (GGDEF)-like protein
VLDGFTIGTAILGERLDATRLRTLQRTFGGELLITAGERVLASTLEPAPPRADASLGVGPHPVRIDDVEYVVASLGVGATQEGAPVRLALLQPVTPTMRRATSALLIELAMSGLIAVALAGFGAALLARSLLEPLEAFVRQLRAGVGAERPGGERWVAMAARSRDSAAMAVEIRWLHLSFARLMASLARKRAQLAYQAYHDPLTGLPNRVRFRIDVDHALARSVEGQSGVAVLFLDLDHFKTINDSLGHAVGDQLLVEVATRLLHATRGCDTVARLGGDEFAVLVDRVRTDVDLSIVVDRILNVMRSPIRLERAEVLVSASIGGVRATPGDGPEELLRNADVAMYRAKQRGRGGYELFAAAMHADVLERLQVEADLRRALTEPELELRVVYQPIVALKNGRTVGYEALVRWAHPTRGIMTPGQFIPLAEATGLVIPLGRWVLRTACRQAAQWQHRDAEPPRSDADVPYVSVNLSGRQLEDAALVDDVATIIADAGLDPSRLLLEITESTLMQRADTTLRTLQQLKALGLQLAIDDFGTGYSSLAYLQRFPVDVLKIDKAFIDGVARGGSDAALARAIVGLAATLGLRSVAEGIERAEQAAELRAAGCEYGQGMLFAGTLGAHEVGARTAAPASLLTGGRRAPRRTR